MLDPVGGSHERPTSRSDEMTTLTRLGSRSKSMVPSSFDNRRHQAGNHRFPGRSAGPVSLAVRAPMALRLWRVLHLLQRSICSAGTERSSARRWQPHARPPLPFELSPRRWSRWFR